jgi:uncharacterized repeat protein (TIGR03803 family)
MKPCPLSRLFHFSILLALTIVVTPLLSAQTLSVLHSFTGGPDGAFPQAGLTLDAAGNLYGTALGGGRGSCGHNDVPGCGVVFKVQRHGSGWTLSPLYSFTGTDNFFPNSRVSFAPNGVLYGTTASGSGGGSVYSLRPPSHVCGSISCPWALTVVHRFGSPNDGGDPAGDLMFDAAGNVYGTTKSGGASAGGTVYEISGGVETILHSFMSGAFDEGDSPESGVVFDSQGNLWGTARTGGENLCGTIFKLQPVVGGWFETTYRDFGQDENDGCNPMGGVIFDPSGNLYGTTYAGGGFLVGGTAYAGILFGPFPYGEAFLGYNGSPTGGPTTSLTRDAAGNLYGATTQDGASGNGSVFEKMSDGTFVSLHDFTGGADGQFPLSNVVVDAQGNLYGTTSQGGAYGYGVIWEITR